MSISQTGPRDQTSYSVHQSDGTVETPPQTLRDDSGPEDLSQQTIKRHKVVLSPNAPVCLGELQSKLQDRWIEPKENSSWTEDED